MAIDLLFKKQMLPFLIADWKPLNSGWTSNKPLNCTDRQNKKLSFWLREKGYSYNKNINQKKIPVLYNNKSNIELNTPQNSILNLGPKFILDEKIDMKEAIPHIERALTYIPENERK